MIASRDTVNIDFAYESGHNLEVAKMNAERVLAWIGGVVLALLVVWIVFSLGRASVSTPLVPAPVVAPVVVSPASRVDIRVHHDPAPRPQVAAPAAGTVLSRDQVPGTWYATGATVTVAKGADPGVNLTPEPCVIGGRRGRCAWKKD